jgi:regulator of replication initiation timing
MKKLILAMVFILLTALLISFNYLLWERESMMKEIETLEYANLADSANINALKREIAGLEEDNKRLDEKNDVLETENSKLLQEKNDLIAEKEKASEEVREKVRKINVLKQYADINTLAEPVYKWAEAINNGDYEEAYAFEFAGISEEDRKVSLDDYVREMEAFVRGIDIQEVRLDKFRGSTEGEIILQVRLNVKLSEGRGKEFFRYEEGINDRYVKIEYSRELTQFYISEISIN